MSRFAASFSAAGHGGAGGAASKRVPANELRLTRDELEQATEVFRHHESGSGEFTMGVGVSNFIKEENYLKEVYLM